MSSNVTRLEALSADMASAMSVATVGETERAARECGKGGDGKEFEAM